MSLAYIENVLSDPESGITKPALMILEAVQGEGGCIPASPRWLKGVREITRRHDIPLVIDEVQTGFGRTGAMFAHEASGIDPDAIVMSKAIGGGFPLAVLAYHERYDKWKAGAHAGTFRGNQIALVAGRATIQFIKEKELLSQVRLSGDDLMSRLADLRSTFPCIGEVRGRGLMIGVEILSPNGDHGANRLDGEFAKLIKQEAFRCGVLVETGGRHGAVLRFLPPLTITKEDVDEAIGRLGEAIGNCLSRHRVR